MRLFSVSLGTLVIALSAAPASAQNVLDRVDPTQEEERADREQREPQQSEVDILARPDNARAFDDGSFRVSAILLDGLVALPPAEFADIVQDYAGRELSSAQLADLSTALAERARSRGYLFATAMIAPQTLEQGVLRIAVDEGAIDEIRVEGVQDAAIAAQLAPLLRAGPVTLPKLERHVLLADDVSGVRIRRTRYERDGDRGILVVEATQRQIRRCGGTDQ